MPGEPEPWTTWPPDEQRRHALKMMHRFLSELQAGELFCMDRGIPWTIGAEGYRRDFVTEWFTKLPYLRGEMPTLWSLVESNQTIGDKSGLLEEIQAAQMRKP